MIIAGFAGIGKTTFCEMYPDETIDMVVMPYKYSNLEEVADTLQDGESIKAHSDLQLVYGWQKKYFEAVKEMEEKHPEMYIFIPTEKMVLEMLYEAGISYTMIYPEETLQEEYRKRYVDRGDSENFIYVFADGWSLWMKTLEDTVGDKRIILKAGEFVTDVIKIVR